jgi:hypothetical protein
MAGRDPKSDSNSIVRLDNCARRALRDFEACINERKAKPSAPSMADIEAELRTHG